GHQHPRGRGRGHGGFPALRSGTGGERRPRAGRAVLGQPAHHPLRHRREPARPRRDQLVPRRAPRGGTGARAGAHGGHRLRPRHGHGEHHLPPRRAPRPPEPDLGADAGRLAGGLRPREHDAGARRRL
ncbi:MAG: hypothetical protein AVDCRST_MAG08-3859, partial [uncultured Acetobacteraceae bacterium]